MEFNTLQSEQLNGIYSLHTQSQGVFLTGKKGIGKSTVAKRFLENKKNILHISVCGKYSYMLEPLVLSINKYYISGSSKYIFEYQNGLHMADRIIYEVVEICKKNEMILYFENITDYEKELFTCVKTLLDVLVNQNKHLKSFLLFDIDTDGNTQFDTNKIYTSLYTISCEFEFIPFSNLERTDLETYFKEIFYNRIKIQEKDLDYIIDSCTGNLASLNMIVNYLKQTAIILKKGDDYICSEITPGSLANVLYDSIMSRYNLLSNEMKQLLEQSSLIGIDFDLHKLRDSFHILRADEELKRIEGISALISAEKNYTYHFENFETYNIILDKIEKDERVNWNNLLAIYYEKQLSSKLSDEEKINFLYKTAFHYKESMHFEIAIYYYIILIRSEMKLLDYQQALLFIKDAVMLNEYIDEQIKQFITPVLTTYEAECNSCLGQYDAAVTLYQRCISEYHLFFSNLEMLNLRLNLAYSAYMNGDLPRAQNITESILKELKKTNSKNILYYRVMSFLSSIYHLLGNDAKASDYYINSLTYCKENGFEEEYYIQLKKASMIFDIEAAQKIVREAADYFEKQNKLSYLAETLHKLSTDNLYLLKLENFEVECKKSIGIFQQYGSLLMHYPLNTLGIYTALIKNDLDSAIEIFENLLKLDVESFSKVTIYTNLITCYRYKQYYKKCAILMKQADLLIEQAENQDIILLQTYHYINKGLYFKAKGQMKKALFIFQQCLEQIELQDRHKVFICNNIRNICLTIKCAVPPLIERNCNIITYPLISLLQEKDMFFATMRFYE